MRIDLVELGASLVKRGVALWSGVTHVSEDQADVQSLPDGDVYQSLGVTSAPFPADSNGKAEALCVRGIAGRNTTFIGARDTRSATIVGNLKPGDTVLHSTGPQQAAQVQCKEDKRQVIAATKDGQGRGMAVLLDGDSGKIQILVPGSIIEMSTSGDITMTNGKASFLMQGDTIALDANVILGSRFPNPAMKVVVSPSVGPAPSPVAPGGIPAMAAKSVSVGL